MKMIRSVIFAMVAVLSVPAFAGSFGEVQYVYEDGVGPNDGTHNNGFEMKIGTELTDTTKVDLVSVYRSTEGVSDTRARLEAGLTQAIPLSETVALYGRVALGNQFTNAEDSLYYSAEGGVKFDPCGPLAFKLGYRFRDATEQDVNFETRTIRAAVSYDISEKSAIALGYDRYQGDFDANGVTLGYQFKF